MTPTIEEVEHVREFAAAVYVYCMHMRASVTSWFRTPLHNSRVGGKHDSRHLIGLGADVVYDAVPLIQDRRALAEKLGLKLVLETDHDHLQ